MDAEELALTWTSAERTRRLGPAVVLAALVWGCQSHGPPYGPREALDTFEIEPGFRIELFAAEPDIVDPVDMEIDENGRIYVVENPGYPLEVQGKLGRVKLLRDLDGDGRPDRITLFADKLTMPTGVMRWKNGILVTDAPDVLYFEDTDGDDRADVQRVVLTGFAFSNPQHTVSSPTYGPDNWIYLAGESPIETHIFPEKFGDRGSDLRFPDQSDFAPVAQLGRSVRFRPDSFQLETLSTSSQFGHTFDDWGHYFTIGSASNGEHEVIAARYLKRNPDLLLRSTEQTLLPETAVFPITERPEHQMLTGIGQITSACGITLYRGGAFPESLGELVFLAEPEHNLVLASVLSPSGASFQLRRLREGTDFLASTDGWFRPVNFYVGPDGALYLLDYYRRVIEHSEWTTREVYESETVYEGNEQGRIYRIVPDSPEPVPARSVRLGDASDEVLVASLENPNVWWRVTAQRLLVDRNSPGSVPLLSRLFRETESGATRVQALWTLEGMGRLDVSLIEEALGDPVAGVREIAVQLAESRLRGNSKLTRKLVGMSGDPDSKVRLQLLLTLGGSESSEARAARERLLEGDLEDRWFQAAALTASSEDVFGMLQRAVSSLAEVDTQGRREFFRLAAAAVGARQRRNEIHQTIETVARASGPGSSWWRAATLQGLAEGIGGRGGDAVHDATAQAVLLKLSQGAEAPVRRASLATLEVLRLPTGPAVVAAVEQAQAIAQNRKADPGRRADAISLLALQDPAGYEAMLKGLVNPQEPDQVQAAAVRAIGRIPNDGTGTFLVGKWREMTAPVRDEAGAALTRDLGRSRTLVKAIMDGQVQPWTLRFRQRLALLMHEDESLREDARALLMQQPEDRERVLSEYGEALTQTGNAGRGREVFESACAKCHRFNGVGQAVGPDLEEVQNRPVDVLLADILMPNQTISSGYEAYVVQTATDGVIEGVMGPQTSTTITLRQEEGKEHVIRRQDIVEFFAANLSAMPGDLEQQVDIQQMSDLLAYLKSSQ